jgi:uncharacterized alpha/beta hydrolase family protein
MKPDTESAAAALLRQIIEENPHATEEQIFKLFHAAAEDNEEVKEAVARFFWKNAGLH